MYFWQDFPQSPDTIAYCQTSGAPDPKLYIWDVELDTVQYFNFETGRGEQDEYMAQGADMEKDSSDLDKWVLTDASRAHWFS